MRRLIFVTSSVVALLVPTTIMTFVVSTPAWATAISCAKLTGRALGVDEFKIYGCAPKMAGYKFVTGIGTDLTTTPGPFTYTWTWSNGTTTVVSISPPTR
jgi:hypothetical protein